MPAVLGLLIELQRPVQIAVVGQGQGVHAGLWPARPGRDAAGSVQQAVMAVAMQMGKGGVLILFLAQGGSSIPRQLKFYRLSSALYRSPEWAVGRGGGVVAPCPVRASPGA